MRIALAGNPNSGKTTMFNALTGKNERVGNWAGVTVEKKAGMVKRMFHKTDEDIVAVDLPGAYSMSPFTSEESITRDYVKNEAPEVIINIVDATNLSRSLFFTTQLLELGIPVVVALNKADVNQKKETKIDTDGLSVLLGCPVVDTVSTSSKGLRQVIARAMEQRGKSQEAPYADETDMTDKAAADEADRRRFSFVNSMVEQVETRKVRTSERNIGDAIDNVLTNRWVGIPIFAVAMFLVFYISQSTLGTWIADYLVGWIEEFQTWVGSQMAGANPLLYSLLVDGVIGGVGAVVGFLPLVMVMYFLISLMEDCGYMARVSVVLDPLFKKVGLSGKSVISFVVGTGCAIPGIMACRTIRDERERRATAMLTPFMPCGAKLPVIALFAGVFFEDAPWVGPLMYFAGILLIFIGALLINCITGNSKKKSFFIMELPEYKFPSLKRGFFSMCSRGWAYIVKAGTIILLCNTVVQIMQTFTWNFTLVEDGAAHTSILASIASPIAVLLVPLGFGVWQMAASAITGFIAKENVVGTIAVCYGITNFINVDELALNAGGADAVAEKIGLTGAAALACLMFNLYSPPCFAAIGAMNAEMKDRRWLWSGVALQLGVGYTVGFLVYQIGTLITTGSPGEGFVPGLIAVGCMVTILTALCVRGSRLGKQKYGAKG